MDVCMGILAGDTGKTSPLYLEKKAKTKREVKFSVTESSGHISVYSVVKKAPDHLVSNFCDRITVHPYSCLALIITS